MSTRSRRRSASGLDRERFQRLSRLFERAAELAADERARFLDDACGSDAGLRAELERMLAVERSPDFLESAPALDALRQRPDAPRRIERFHLLEPLGEGGFGIVYRAEERGAVSRTVAVKVLQRGRVDPISRLRFELERQTLARMQHPAIAPIFDAGETPEGDLWFAMELVDGRPITSALDERRATIDERLDLFLQVCAAVQHAHQRGVVHRDLKPNNVLVVERDGILEPRVIDFGIAKLLRDEPAPEPRTAGRSDEDRQAGASGPRNEGDARRAGDTRATGDAWTHDGLFLGTPGYLSPEQARGGAVDTRSDVYALGVLLFELLTGALPHPRERWTSTTARAHTPSRVERATREDDSAPRSIAAALRTGDLVALAHDRSCKPLELQRLGNGDLERLLRRSLAVEPERRYPSVEALAADLHHLRAHEPIEERAGDRLHVARLFVVRHRWAVAAAALVLLSLAGWIGGLSWALRVVGRARSAAEDGRRAAVASEYAARVTAARAALTGGDEEGARQLLDGTAVAHRGWEWRHLRAQCDDSLASIPGDAPVFRIQWLDGERLLACRANEAFVASGETLESRTPFDLNATRFDDLAYDAASGRLVLDLRDRLELRSPAIGGRDIGARDIGARDIAGSARVLFEPREDLRSLALSPGGRWLLTSENGGLLRLFDLDTGAPPRVLARRPSFAWDIEWLADTGFVALGTEGGRIELIELASGACADEFELHREDVKALAASADGEVLFAGAGDSVQSWRWRDRRRLARQASGTELRELALSPDGRHLFGCGGWSQGDLVVWDARTLERIARFAGHAKGVHSLSLNPARPLLASSSLDGSVRLWRTEASPACEIRDAGYDALQLSMAPDGRAFGVVTRGGRVSLYDAEPFEPRWEVEVAERLLGCAVGRETVWVAGDELVALARADGRVLARAPLDGIGGRLLLDRDARWLACAQLGGGALSFARLPSLEPGARLELGQTQALAYDASRRAFVVATHDGRVLAVDPEHGRIVDEFEARAPIWFLSVVGDELFACGERVQRLSPGTRRFEPVDLEPSSNRLLLDPSGERLVTGGSDMRVRFWTRERTELVWLEGPPKPILDLAFSREGRRLIALSSLPGSPSYLASWRAPAADELEVPSSNRR